MFTVVYVYIDYGHLDAVLIPRIRLYTQHMYRHIIYTWYKVKAVIIMRVNMEGTIGTYRSDSDSVE